MEADFEALKALTANLDALDKSAERAAAHGDMRAFYHRLLMKCAARLSVNDFTQAIKAAEAPEERYQPGPLADDIEEARR